MMKRRASAGRHLAGLIHPLQNLKQRETHMRWKTDAVYIRGHTGPLQVARTKERAAAAGARAITMTDDYSFRPGSAPSLSPCDRIFGTSPSCARAHLMAARSQRAAGPGVPWGGEGSRCDFLGREFSRSAEPKTGGRRMVRRRRAPTTPKKAPRPGAEMEQNRGSAQPWSRGIRCGSSARAEAIVAPAAFEWEVRADLTTPETR